MLTPQREFDLRCEWALPGRRAAGPGCRAVVIVDVLSFSTCVDIAVGRGASVLPYRWKDAKAAGFALRNQAHLASPHRSWGDWSLSPASLQSIPAGTALVLPSPNGSTLCLAEDGVPVYTACLRNAAAVAARLAAAGGPLAVIPAGEQWEDGTLRPCLEDWIGAGAVLSLLPGTPSPEAELAIAGYERFRGDLCGVLWRCGSGKELRERGFPEDVELAAAYGASSAVPFLSGDRFIDCPR